MQSIGDGRISARAIHSDGASLLCMMTAGGASLSVDRDRRLGRATGNRLSIPLEPSQLTTRRHGQSNSYSHPIQHIRKSGPCSRIDGGDRSGVTEFEILLLECEPFLAISHG